MDWPTIGNWLLAEWVIKRMVRHCGNPVRVGPIISNPNSLISMQPPYSSYTYTDLSRGDEPGKHLESILGTRVVGNVKVLPVCVPGIWRKCVVQGQSVWSALAKEEVTLSPPWQLWAQSSASGLLVAMTSSDPKHPSRVWFNHLVAVRAEYCSSSGWIWHWCARPSRLLTTPLCGLTEEGNHKSPSTPPKGLVYKC